MGLFSGDNSDWRIGIAFSGGGARCMAHLGVLKALEDADIRPQVMAGTSMGAIIGALYAKGVSIETMLNEIEKINFVGMLRRLRLRSKTGLMSLDHFRNLLGKYLSNSDFKALGIPFYISVANLNTGKNEIFNSGPLIDLLLASASIPILFETVKINDQHYVDGGLFNNLPVNVIRDECDMVIGVHVNEIQSIHNLKSIGYTIDRIVSLSVYQNVLQSRQLCDVFIEPKNARRYPIFAFSKTREIYELGYDAGCEAVPRIIQLMEENPVRRRLNRLFKKRR